jgi:hypothetical protein
MHHQDPEMSLHSQQQLNQAYHGQAGGQHPGNPYNMDRPGQQLAGNGMTNSSMMMNSARAGGSKLAESVVVNIRTESQPKCRIPYTRLQALIFRRQPPTKTNPRPTWIEAVKSNWPLDDNALLQRIEKQANSQLGPDASYERLNENQKEQINLAMRAACKEDPQLNWSLVYVGRSTKRPKSRWSREIETVALYIILKGNAKNGIDLFPKRTGSQQGNGLQQGQFRQPQYGAGHTQSQQYGGVGQNMPHGMQQPYMQHGYQYGLNNSHGQNNQNYGEGQIPRMGQVNRPPHTPQIRSPPAKPRGRMRSPSPRGRGQNSRPSLVHHRRRSDVSDSNTWSDGSDSEYDSRESFTSASSVGSYPKSPRYRQEHRRGSKLYEEFRDNPPLLAEKFVDVVDCLSKLTMEGKSDIDRKGRERRYSTYKRNGYYEETDIDRPRTRGRDDRNNEQRYRSQSQDRERITRRNTERRNSDFHY